MASTDVSEDKSLSMRTVIGAVKLKWRHISNMSTQALHEHLCNQTAAGATRTGGGETNGSDQLTDRPMHLLLLDTRPVEEFSVSRLQGAARVDPDGSDVSETLSQFDQSGSTSPVTVVCYCSVGYRSTNYAARLQEALCNQPTAASNVKVYNLEGGLFKWANEHRPMVDDAGQPTGRCHPYSAIWGRLLNATCRYSPISS